MSPYEKSLVLMYYGDGHGAEWSRSPAAFFGFGFEFLN